MCPGKGKGNSLRVQQHWLQAPDFNNLFFPTKAEQAPYRYLEDFGNIRE